MKPDKNNVNLGDLLVVECAKGYFFLPIVKIEDKGINANKNKTYAYRHYDDAFVIKKDGTYLLGELVKKESNKLLNKLGK